VYETVPPRATVGRGRKEHGMATGPPRRMARPLRGALLLRDGPTDAQLLGRFVEAGDGSAFEGLVRRHGGMVLGLCRRVLGNGPGADDAFQAAFLVLARKAGSVTPRERVAGWLYGVAYRTAWKARTAAVRRREREHPVAELPEPAVAPPEPHDWRPLLDR